MSMRFLPRALAGVCLALFMSIANASLVNISFTASGSAIGAGNLVVDSSFLSPGSFNCCGPVPAGFQSLNLSLNFGSGATLFDLGDLTGTTYVLATDALGTITDINFWGTNEDGVTITGISPFTEAASGAKGANGVFHYTVTGVANAVPEPASLALLAFGLAGLGATRRRNRV